MPCVLKSCRIWIAFLFLAGWIAAAPGIAQAGKAQKESDKRSGKANAEAYPNNGYVGSAACSRCHLEIAQHFAKASMGHSLTAITPDFVKTLAVPASYYDTKSNHHFDVHLEGGKLFESSCSAALAFWSTSSALAFESYSTPTPIASCPEYFSVEL